MARFNSGANMAGASGTWKVTQLPFNSASSYYHGNWSGYNLGFDTAEFIVLYTYGSTAEIYFLATQNNGVWEDIGFGNGSNWYLMGTMNYHTT